MSNEPYKVELIEAIPGNEPLRMYWHGDWQDLCRGPHLQNTGQVPGDSWKLMSVAGAYWRGDSERPMLQRIYGVAFKNKEDLRAHLNFLEEAAKRDHRKLGREMNLFHFEEVAPGSVFWHPSGWHLFQTLINYMRRRQEKAGYVEVNTQTSWIERCGKPQGIGLTTWKICFSHKLMMIATMRLNR